MVINSQKAGVVGLKPSNNRMNSDWEIRFALLLAGYAKQVQMKPQWPQKIEREQFEISHFISAYSRLPHGRFFVVHSRIRMMVFILSGLGRRVFFKNKTHMLRNPMTAIQKKIPVKKVVTMWRKKGDGNWRIWRG